MKLKFFVFIIAICSSVQLCCAQDKLFSKTGKIEFKALDDNDVDASSRAATILLDAKTGGFNFSILVKSFEFEKALMQEKFNNQVLETDKFPKAAFDGQITNAQSVNYQKAGTYNVEIKGRLTLHGITHDITMQGTITVDNAKVVAKASYKVLLGDYQVHNPGIGDSGIQINAEFNLEPLKN